MNVSESVEVSQDRSVIAATYLTNVPSKPSGSERARRSCSSSLPPTKKLRCASVRVGAGHHALHVSRDAPGEGQG